MQTQLENINILDLLPQRPPFIMVDKLTNFIPASATTIFEVRNDNLFCKNGAMEESGLIENIAQTCAAGIGFAQKNNAESDKEKVKIGVIAIIHSLEMKRRPLVGEVLETTMAIEEEYFTTTLVRAEVKIGNEIIASGKMKLFLTDKTPDE